MSAVLLEERAPAKINLALHVLGRRSDGYHELDSIVAFAEIGDRLTLQSAATTSLSVTGPFGDGLAVDQGNLVLQAYRALASYVNGKDRDLPPVAFQLEKNLPVASGIGGGSADAAAALRGLVRFASLDVPAKELGRIALSLGADVPVCLLGKVCRMQGVGELIEPVDLRLPAAAVLVNPRVAVSTPAVFAELGLQPGANHGSALDPANSGTWRNDLTEPARKLVPQVDEVLAALASATGIEVARMSGSGATCFGLAASLQVAQRAADDLRQAHPHWWIASTRIS